MPSCRSGPNRNRLASVLQAASCQRRSRLSAQFLRRQRLRVKSAQPSSTDVCSLTASLHITQCASLRRLSRAVPASGLSSTRAVPASGCAPLRGDGVRLRRLRRRGPLLQVLPDLQGVHEEHRRQIYLRPRAAAASSPFAPTAPSTSSPRAGPGGLLRVPAPQEGVHATERGRGAPRRRGQGRGTRVTAPCAACLLKIDVL